MERSEPKLAPEWLKSVGNKPASSSASSLQLGVSEASKFTSKSSSVNGTGYDLGRPISADHAALSHSQRSSNRSSSDHLRSYSNFGRNRHYRDRYRDKYENSVQPDTSRKNSGSRTQKDGFRPSQLMISERHGEKLMRNSCSGENNSPRYCNGLPDKYGLFNTLHRSESERGFLLPGAEGRQTATGIGRVRSPGVSTATQSTTRSFSDVKNGDKWTSPLAEVPPTTGSDGSGCSSVQLATPLATPTLSTATGAGFNMAEAVAKSPRSVQTTSQLSNGNQRLEDLAIKQSRILIPVTPSAPKISALNPSDKIKSKVTEQRQQQQHHLLSSSHVANNSVRSEGLVTTDALKTSSFGKLHVLKPTRERNGVSSVVNNCLDPNPDVKGIKPMLSPVATMQRPIYNPVSPTAERKPSRAVTEKRLSSQAQSRNDFFNLMRKKSMVDSCATSDTAAPEVSTAPTTQGQDTPSSDNPSESMPVDNTNEDTGKGDALDGKKQLRNGKTHPSPDAILCSEEEEAAFLRSLGWEENADEGGLTEEEISTFYRDVTKYINSKLPLKILQGVQPRLMLTLNS